ncbi:hypothetical protein R3P38DRAFT_2812226 [Favolaschia claudopus]|uniref:Uncharacterized protein n=2 Tax=Favolaschia claudopus TaxID=2862362 RepID=A0AAV9Z7V7_9AGAR
MPRDDHRDCPCGCGTKQHPNQIRRHLRQQTTQSVRVAQQHSYAEQRQRLLRLEVKELIAGEPRDRGGGGGEDENEDFTMGDDGGEPAATGADSGLPGMQVDSDNNDAPPQSPSDRNHTPDLSEEGSDTDQDSELGDDPFETRLQELFWDDSDEEDEGTGLGDDFRAAPWIQGLAPLDRLREVFDIDAAQRGELEKCTESVSEN